MAHYVEIEKNKKYKLVVETGHTASGGRSRRTKTVQASGVRQARDLLREFQNEIDDSAHLMIGDPSFVDFVQQWKENFAIPELEAPTLENYEMVLEPIEKYFKNMKLKNIITFHITSFFNAERKEKRGSLPAKYKVLNSIFRYAVKWQLIDKEKNPMKEVSQPKHCTTQHMDHYREDEIPILLELLKTLEERQQLMVELALFGGLRRGEVAGIADDVIDFSSCRIEIKRSLQQSKNMGVRLKETKEKDTRFVTYSEKFMKKLHAYYVKKLNLRMDMANLWKGFKDVSGQDVFLLFSDEYGVPHNPNSITQFWIRFNKRFEGQIRRIRFHDLRHSSATIILSQSSKDGMTMKTVQKRLGHKNIKTTLNLYSHVTEEDDKKAGNVFDKFL